MVDKVKIAKSLKLGLMFPAYKGKRKSKDDDDSYRGITLMSTLYKVFENAIWNRMKQWTMTQKFPHPMQLAGRIGGNALDASLCLQESVFYHLERGGKVFSCFIDAEKAFDKVWWNGLLYKLFRLGIKDKLWYLLQECFKDSTGVILYDGQYSDKFCISQGIKQGGVMSMFFYTVYVMDVHDYVDAKNDGLRVANIPVGSLSYADDIVLMSSTKKGLDRMMYNMNACGRMWRISYSATKTKCLVFGESKSSKRSLMATRSWYMGDKSIEECLDIVHLGIKLDTCLNTTIRIKDMCTKGKAIFFSLSQVGVRPSAFNPLTSANVWSKVALPAMTYGCELWQLSATNLGQLEIAQNLLPKQYKALK